MVSEPGTQRELERAQMMARRLRIAGVVRLLRGTAQGETGSRVDISAGVPAAPRQARKFSQLGDGFFGLVTEQQLQGRPTGAKDAYLFTGMESKLASQVGKLPAQLSLTFERLEGLGIRIGSDVFVPNDRAKPGQNRLFLPRGLP